MQDQDDVILQEDSLGLASKLRFLGKIVNHNNLPFLSFFFIYLKSLYQL